MKDRLDNRWSEVRCRVRRRRCLRGFLIGLGVGSLIPVVALIGRGSEVLPPPLVLSAMSVSCGMIGLLIGFTRRFENKDAARAMDRSHGLKDACVTAYELSHRDALSGFEELSLATTWNRLSQIQSRDSVTLRGLGRLWSTPLILALLLIALAIVSSKPAIHGATVEEVEADGRILRENEELTKTLERLDELLRLLPKSVSNRPSFAEDLESLRGELEKNGMTLREAFSALSNKQSELSKALESLNELQEKDPLNAQLDAMGDAFAKDERYRDIASALAKDELHDASKKIEEASQENTPGGSEMTDALDRVAESMREEGLDPWSDATESLSNSLKNTPSSGGHSESDRKDAAKRLQELLEERARSKEQASKLTEALKEANRALENAKNELAQSAEDSQGKADGSKDFERSREENGRSSTIEHDSSAGSAEAGTGVHGKIDGEAESIEVRKRLESIELMKGEGPMKGLEKSIPSPSSSEPASSSRPYIEVFEEYQKLSENSILKESIPAGYRNLIREYFKSIRPDQRERDS